METRKHEYTSLLSSIDFSRRSQASVDVTMDQDMSDLEILAPTPEALDLLCTMLMDQILDHILGCHMQSLVHSRESLGVLETQKLGYTLKHTVWQLL
jgi:hypothetical protein